MSDSQGRTTVRKLLEKQTNKSFWISSRLPIVCVPNFVFGWPGHISEYRKPSCHGDLKNEDL